MRRGAPWREQAAAKIKRDFHRGRGKDDPGAIGPLARDLLDRSEDIEHLVLELERINGKTFDRFDTDQGNGIDLPEILRISVFWGKYALRPESERPPEYDIQQIEASYEAMKDPKIRDLRFRELLAIAKLIATPPSKKGGRKKDYLKAEMIRELYDHLRERFGDRPSGEDIFEIISICLGLVRMRIDSDSVKRALTRAAKRPEDERGNLERAKRRYKAERRTGSPDGRRGGA